jgi:Flp pilus assembly pilin Flp
MALINRLLETLRRDEDGQGLAEYALILALLFLGGAISGILSTIGTSV